MKRIKEALAQAKQDGVLTKSSVVAVKGEQQTQDGLSAVEPKPEVNSELIGKLKDLNLDRKFLKKSLVFEGHETDSFSMAYKMLRTQVYQKMLKNYWTTLGITSSSTGEGKSLTALNLAFSLSRSSAQPIVLLDLDLRRPSLTTKIGVTPEMGIADYLLEGKPLEEVLFKASDNLIVSPGIVSIKDASEVLGSYSMVKLLRELKALFPDSLILFDLPPVLVVDDVMALSPLLDACLVVAEEGRTKQTDIEQAMDLLQMTNILGVVLNRSGELEKSHYYSSY